ncbi:MAG: hypothetical protein PHI19_07835, partial [Clostridia bacterium]|nr:hypothetical protein [Clostridia bacterium]
SPFSITDYSKLDYIKVFPWAYFKQTADIILPDDYAALATLVPLMGTYNGDGYDIRCGTVEFEDAYGGLFGLVYEGTLTNIKIVGINISHTASTDIYLGGLVGVGKNATISNVVLSGTITVNAALYNVYVGGLVGSLTASVMSDCVSMVNITVTNASSAYVGGIIAQAQNATGVNNIVSLSKITVNFSNNGFVGSSIGTAFDQGVTGQKVYNVEGSTYVNGRIYDATIDSNQGNVQEIYKRSYNDTVGVASGIMLGEKSILELIADLYPFESGTGTMMDPFRIVNYNQLLKIGSYMYANFVIENDIVIGDVDGDSNNNGVADGKEPDGVPTPDGKLDSFDEYDYSFQSLGKGTVFTGSISGGYHSITGLTEPLFEANNGTISELTLNLSYRQYASANSVPVGISGAKVDASGKDVIYGGVAKYNYPNGKMNSVTVGGTVIIQTAGKAKVKAGGIVGIAYGGSIIGCLNAVDMQINSLLADVGGIAGTLQGNTVMTGSTSGSFTFGYNYTVASIRVNGGSVKAGLVVGAVRFQNLDLEVEAADTSAHVYINGVDKGSERLIGYNIN